MWNRALRTGEGRPDTLRDGALIVVAGGGPAGSIFAIRTLREARRQGRSVRLIICERKKRFRSPDGDFPIAAREGCNYCAGGISPRLGAALKELGLTLPDEIVAARAESLTVHGDWKSIELPIPPDREMMSVFRGSRPRQRELRHHSLDSFILQSAVEEGAVLWTGEVAEVRYGEDGRPVVSILHRDGREESLAADFAVFAAGVNQILGKEPGSLRLYRSLQQLLPRFTPPRVRRALICELQAEPELLRRMRGEVHFALYGTPELPIEMSSLIPKGKWITVVLLGESVDRAEKPEYLEIMRRFLAIPHIRRLIPRDAHLNPVCVCSPGMTVGTARHPFGDRVALIGDMAVSRLYKDGIFSAYVTASALSNCILNEGLDRRSLRRGYWKAVRRFRTDNIFGRAVFFINRVAFSHPSISRIVYQAVLTERKKKPRHRRRLADLLWRIASGDDSYRRIMISMLHPATAWLILVGGALVTLRNTVAERILGLSWADMGRHPTGVSREELEKHRREIGRVSAAPYLERLPEFERMYRIKIMAEPSWVYAQLGKFGEPERKYLRVRIVEVKRVAGQANAVGSVIRYDVLKGWISFEVRLEKALGTRMIIYRVLNGFAKDGVLAFEIYKNEDGVSLLSIYVAYDFPAGRNRLAGLGWRLFKLFFPGFVHDVAWNHALCEIKNNVESEAAGFD